MWNYRIRRKYRGGFPYCWTVLKRLEYRGYDSAGVAVVIFDKPRNLAKSVTVE